MSPPKTGIPPRAPQVAKVGGLPCRGGTMSHHAIPPNVAPRPTTKAADASVNSAKRVRRNAQRLHPKQSATSLPPPLRPPAAVGKENSRPGRRKWQSPVASPARVIPWYTIMHSTLLYFYSNLVNRPGVLTRSVLGIREMAKAFWGSADLGKSPLRADANRGSSNVGFAKRERRRVQNLILSESSRRTPRESSGAAANRPSVARRSGDPPSWRIRRPGEPSRPGESVLKDPPT